MDSWELTERQGLPLDTKINMSAERIKEWHSHYDGKVHVSFSGGKDSTALLHLVRTIYPDTKAVFVDTGLEYPEIREFVKSTDNVVWLKPKMSFRRVIDKYGYPVISKSQATAISRFRGTDDPVQRHRRIHGWPNGKSGVISEKWLYMIHAPFKISGACCRVMKKDPLDRYFKETGSAPMSGMMAGDSIPRKKIYIRCGCNPFDAKKPVSWPLAFWTDKDVWEYIKERDVDYCKIYDMGEKRTGCMFCMFGVQFESEPNRFQRMKKTHPAQYNYCMNKLGLKSVLEYMDLGYEEEQIEMFGEDK